GRSGAGRPSAAGGIRTRRSRVHVGEPVRVLLGLTLRRREERALELLGDRAAGALAHHAVVDLADRRELRRGAREEGLVGVVEVAAHEILLAHRVPEIAGDSDHAVARDAVETAGLRARRGELAVADDEDVLARSVGHVPALV